VKRGDLLATAPVSGSNSVTGLDLVVEQLDAQRAARSYSAGKTSMMSPRTRKVPRREVDRRCACTACRPGGAMHARAAPMPVADAQRA
jgi:hypothetical protein